MRTKVADKSVIFDRNIVPTAAWIVGAAIGLGVFGRVLDGIFRSSPDVTTQVTLGLFGVLVAAPVAFALGLVSVVLVRQQATALRALATGHPRSVRHAYLALALFLVLLALSAVVAVAGRGHTLGAVASVSVRLLVAGLIGGGTVVLAFWPHIFGPDTKPRARWRYVYASVWLIVGSFLLSTDEFGFGIGMLFTFGLLLSGYVKRTGTLLVGDKAGFSGGFLGLCYLVATVVLWLRLTIDPAYTGTLVRYAAETVIAGVLGTATALTTWRHSREARPIIRRLGSAATVVVPAYLVFLLLDDQILGGALMAPLFPVMIWLGIRLWLRMGTDERVGVKAAADVVCALILGSVLVLFLIWLANLLALSPSEVQVLKTVASATHAAIDLSPWIWVGIYAVLAAAHLLGALGPKKYQAIPRRLASLHVVPSVKIVRRAMTMTGIGLMVVALLGLVVPPATGPILRRQIEAAYTVAAQEELRDEEEMAVDQTITAQLTSSRPQLFMLADLVVDVHRTGAPDKKTGAASPAELDLAQRLGRLQGQLIAEQAQPERPTGSATGSTAADLVGPIRDAEDLQQRLAEEQHEDTLRQARDKQAETAADLGAYTVTSLLDLISLGHAEALGIVHEYINGLAESPLGEIFLDWTKRALNKISPDKLPAATEVVEPDPQNLASAAESDLGYAQATPGDLFPPFAAVPEQDPAAIEEAVTAENQTAGIEQKQSECPNCAAPDEPGQDEPAHDEPVPEVHGP
jgi:hypothetical protein